VRRGDKHNGTSPFPGHDGLEDAPSNNFFALRRFDASKQIDDVYAEWRPDKLHFGASFTNATEAYDIAKDGWQLNNLAPTLPKAEKAARSKRLWELADCVGDSCT